MRQNPFEVAAPAEGDDLELVRLARDGSREALEALVARHQAWIYNIALRMIYHPQDAEDATQEILIKLVTRLSTFEGWSTVRTWLYRIVCNHVLNMKRGRVEALDWNFAAYGNALENAPDAELPDQATVPVDVQLLVLLNAVPSGRIVEIGALHVNMDELAPAVRERISTEPLPFGRVLQDAHLACRSRPTAFFAVTPHQPMMAALSMQEPATLGGRKAEIRTSHALIACAIEILPQLDEAVIAAAVPGGPPSAATYAALRDR